MRSMPIGHRYLTLHELAVLIGHQDDRSGLRRLKRSIRRRELQNRAKIFVTQKPLQTTMPLLRRHFPEWFPTRDYVAEMLNKRFEELIDEQKLLSMKLNSLAAKLREHCQTRHDP